MQKMVFMNKRHRLISVSKIKLSISKFESVIFKTTFYGISCLQVMYNVFKINGSNNLTFDAQHSEICQHFKSK